MPWEGGEGWGGKGREIVDGSNKEHSNDLRKNIHLLKPTKSNKLKQNDRVCPKLRPYSVD